MKESLTPIPENAKEPFLLMVCWALMIDGERSSTEMSAASSTVSGCFENVTDLEVSNQLNSILESFRAAESAELQFNFHEAIANIDKKCSEIEKEIILSRLQCVLISDGLHPIEKEWLAWLTKTWLLPKEEAE